MARMRDPQKTYQWWRTHWPRTVHRLWSTQNQGSWTIWLHQVKGPARWEKIVADVQRQASHPIAWTWAHWARPDHWGLLIVPQGAQASGDALGDAAGHPWWRTVLEVLPHSVPRGAETPDHPGVWQTDAGSARRLSRVWPAYRLALWAALEVGGPSGERATSTVVVALRHYSQEPAVHVAWRQTVASPGIVDPLPRRPRAAPRMGAMDQIVSQLRMAAQADVGRRIRVVVDGREYRGYLTHVGSTGLVIHVQQPAAWRVFFSWADLWQDPDRLRACEPERPLALMATLQHWRAAWS